MTSTGSTKTKHDFITDDWEDFEGVFHSVVYCRLCYQQKDGCQSEFCEDKERQTFKPEKPLYFWSGHIFNEFGGIVEKSCIGTLQSVATQLTLNGPYPDGKTPKIRRVCSLSELNEQENNEVLATMKVCEDI